MTPVLHVQLKVRKTLPGLSLASSWLVAGPAQGQQGSLHNLRPKRKFSEPACGYESVRNKGLAMV